jgi:AcrR family transcriptional regulator
MLHRNGAAHLVDSDALSREKSATMSAGETINNLDVQDRPVRRKPESLSKLKAAARKLFVARGYHDTRPQDIAREAGLGHGTFYLHYPDKRACFLAFVEEARQDLNVHLSAVRQPGQSLEELIGATINAIYDYSDLHPGVLRAAMTDAMVIDAEGAPGVPLLVLWGQEWADLVREAAGRGMACNSYDPAIIGQAIVGALHQAGREASSGQRCRVALVDNLTRFLAKALRPD